MPVNRNASGLFQFFQNGGFKPIYQRKYQQPNRNFQGPYQRIYVADGKENQKNVPEKEAYQGDYYDSLDNGLVKNDHHYQSDNITEQFPSNELHNYFVCTPTR